MHTTRAFKNGNSQAVRIPADLAYERTDIDLEIEREGDEIRIRPARRSLAGVLTKFAQFSPEFMAEGGFIGRAKMLEQAKRDIRILRTGLAPHRAAVVAGRAGRRVCWRCQRVRLFRLRAVPVGR